MKLEFFHNLFNQEKNYEKKSFIYSNIASNNWVSTINYTYLEQTYKNNGIVFRCIQMINQCICSMKITCNDTRIEKYLNYNLSEIISHIFIYGNCFLNKNIELIPIHQVTIIRSSSNEKVTKYKINGKLYDATDILHLKYAITPNSSYSVSPIQVCAPWIDIYGYIQDYISTMMKYGGKPSGILSYNNMLNEKDRNLLKEQFQELYKNVANGGTVILTNSSISWQSIGMEPEKLRLLEHLTEAIEEIASCFGIPSILLNVNGNVTFTNYRESRNQFWNDTLIPFVKHIINQLSFFLNIDITIDSHNKN